MSQHSSQSTLLLNHQSVERIEKPKPTRKRLGTIGISAIRVIVVLTCISQSVMSLFDYYRFYRSEYRHLCGWVCLFAYANLCIFPNHWSPSSSGPIGSSGVSGVRISGTKLVARLHENFTSTKPMKQHCYELLSNTFLSNFGEVSIQRWSPACTEHTQYSGPPLGGSGWVRAYWKCINNCRQFNGDHTWPPCSPIASGVASGALSRVIIDRQ